MDQHRTERPASPYEKNFTLLLMKKYSAPGTALGYFASSSHDMFYLRNRLNSSGLQRINWFLTDTGNPNRKKKRATF